jgi:NADH-quinone oxidoreductase subunit N
LFLFSFLALSSLCFCNDFLVIYVILELQSLAFYILAGFWKNSEYSNEAGLRYFIIGAFSSCLLMLSFSFIYVSVGSTSFDTIVNLISEDLIKFNLHFFGVCLFFAGIFFKLGAVPCHFWICDVYEGSLTNISAFFSIIPKSIIFCLLFKSVSLAFSNYSQICSLIITASGITSVFVSSLAGLYQKKIKRLLAYSAIGHTGFILLAFSSGKLDSIRSALLYLVIYIVMNLGLFSLLLGFSLQGFLFKYLINWSFLKKWNITISLALAILLFSIAGIPPLAGFYSKLNVLLLLIFENRVVLALTLVILSCVSCFFYIRLIKILFFSSSGNILFDINNLKGFELSLTTSFLFVIFFLTKPESLNNLLSFVTLLFIS